MGGKAAVPEFTPSEFNQLLAGAQKGDVSMQNIVGMLYWQGGNLPEGERWLRAAAGNGRDDAAFNLGVLFQNDRGDFAEAERWFNFAAAQGNDDAMFALGALRWREEDVEGAKHWWLLAARAGNENAMNNIEALLD